MANLEPTYLLDCNVLIALSDEQHTLHDAAEEWMQRNMGNFATCPITQGCLLRFCLQFGNNPGMDGAKEVLSRFTKRSNHVFLPDDLNFLDVPARGVRGHKQVTDAYLAALAKRHGVRLATFDRGLAILLDNVVELIPT